MTPINNEKRTARNTRWRKAHPEVAAARTVLWRRANPETYAAGHARWMRENPDKRAAQGAKRRASQLQATPAWVNGFFCAEAYALAKLRTEMLGFEWHVDHIVPLKSPFVCGLHVEYNLQVIPAVDNVGKGNRHWPGMP